MPGPPVLLDRGRRATRSRRPQRSSPRFSRSITHRLSNTPRKRRGAAAPGAVERPVRPGGGGSRLHLQRYAAARDAAGHPRPDGALCARCPNRGASSAWSIPTPSWRPFPRRLRCSQGSVRKSIDAFLARMEMQVPPEGLAHFGIGKPSWVWPGSPRQSRRRRLRPMPICPPGSWSIRRVRRRSIWILAPCTVPQRRLQRPIAMVIRFSWRKLVGCRRHASRSSAPGPGGRFGGGGLAGLALAVAGWWGLRPMAAVSSDGLARRWQRRPWAARRGAPLQRLRLPRRSLRNTSQRRPPRRRPWLLPRRLRRPALQRRAARPAPAEPVPTPPPAAGPEKPGGGACPTAGASPRVAPRRPARCQLPDTAHVHSQRMPETGALQPPLCASRRAAATRPTLAAKA